jgi:hypothetical protein
MYYGICWVLILLVSELFKRTDLVFDIIIGICIVGIVYYFTEKFERNINLHPTIKWFLSILIYLIGFVLYMKNGL